MNGMEFNLKKEQEKTLSLSAPKFNFLLKIMFFSMDVLYGKKRTLQKFKVIELLARYPYMAWENRAYIEITKHYTTQKKREKTEDILRLIDLGRKSQDNEQWHLFLISDLMKQKKIRQNFLLHNFIPKILGLKYYCFSKILYFFKPEWSFAMNAKFEAHAEREYMMIVKENPQWENEVFESRFFKYYPKQKNLADLFRRIGLDEREHKIESFKEYKRLTGKELK